MSTLVDLTEIDPRHLRELADLLIEKERRRAEERAAFLAELHEAPALGAFGKRPARGLPVPPPGFRWNGRALLEAAR